MNNEIIIVNAPLPLDAGATYTSGFADVSAYNSIMLAVSSDVSGTMYADFSTDGVNVQSTLSFDVSSNIPDLHRLTIGRRFFRVRYVNDSVAQTSFSLQCIAGNHEILSAPVNAVLQRDADATLVRSIPSFLEISTNKFAGIRKNNKSGRNGDIDTATVPEWVWENGGVYTGFPTGTPEQIEVVSDNANDTAAGSGARSVTVFGLDENFLQATETIALNGTTPVVSVGTFSRVHSAFVASSGSTNQAFNAGIITVRHTTTTANVFLTIQAGRNQSNAAVFTVPDGKVGVVVNLRVEVDRANASSISGFLWVREDGKCPRYRRPFTASNSSVFIEEPYGGLVFPSKTDLGVVVTAVYSKQHICSSCV